MGVYKRVPISECWARTKRKPIGVRWVDVNKGTDECPNYRSRLVAKEIKTDDRLEYFSATPPLEALRLLLSFAASMPREEVRVMHIDVRRAYFHARVKRDVYVALPLEDYECGDEVMCGKLAMSMYGTRDATNNWEETYTEVLLKHGFTQGATSPCAYFHKGRGNRLVVHGDDFPAV